MRQTASGGSSGAWSSLGRTSVVWNHLIQNESHTVYASGGRGLKEHLICTWRGKEFQTTHRKELCFNMSQEWTFRKVTLRLLLRLEALLSSKSLSSWWLSKTPYRWVCEACRLDCAQNTVCVTREQGWTSFENWKSNVDNKSVIKSKCAKVIASC